MTVFLPCLSEVDEIQPGVVSHSMLLLYVMRSRASASMGRWQGTGEEQVRKWLLIIVASWRWLRCTCGHVYIWCSVVSVIVSPSARHLGHHGLTIVPSSVSWRMDLLYAFGSRLVMSLCRNVVRKEGQCLLPVDHPGVASVR